MTLPAWSSYWMSQPGREALLCYPADVPGAQSSGVVQEVLVGNFLRAIAYPRCIP
jgi:hypothetical protein